MIIKILGWQMGFEPTTLGITIRCSNQLSYNHQKLNIKNGTPDRNRTRNPRLRRSVLYPVELRALMPIRAKNFVVGAVGFELTTLCSQSRCANRAALRPD